MIIAPAQFDTFSRSDEQVGPITLSKDHRELGMGGKGQRSVLNPRTSFENLKNRS